MPYTFIETDWSFPGDGVWSCNDCGAHATKKEDIKHHASCVPGESKKWERFYEEAAKEQELEDKAGQ